MAKLPKRVGNQNRKARRAESWVRGQERKKVRRERQAERERTNREYRARGELTPSQIARRQRRAYRNVVQYLRKQFGTCVRAHPDICYRPYGHKGRCGQLTQTEIKMAGQIQARG